MASNGKIQVGDVIEVLDEEGNTVQAKIVDKNAYRIQYKTRKSDRGRFSQNVTETTRKAFNNLRV